MQADARHILRHLQPVPVPGPRLTSSRMVTAQDNCSQLSCNLCVPGAAPTTVQRGSQPAPDYGPAGAAGGNDARNPVMCISHLRANLTPDLL